MAMLLGRRKNRRDGNSSFLSLITQKISRGFLDSPALLYTSQMSLESGTFSGAHEISSSYLVEHHNLLWESVRIKNHVLKSIDYSVEFSLEIGMRNTQTNLNLWPFLEGREDHRSGKVQGLQLYYSRVMHIQIMFLSSVFFFCHMCHFLKKRWACNALDLYEFSRGEVLVASLCCRVFFSSHGWLHKKESISLSLLPLSLVSDMPVFTLDLDHSVLQT